MHIEMPRRSHCAVDDDLWRLITAHRIDSQPNHAECKRRSARCEMR
jgi:hypothetical protein